MLDLFDTLDESTSNEQLSLSYSDQLAEILPGTTPLQDTSLGEISDEDLEHGSIPTLELCEGDSVEETDGGILQAECHTVLADDPDSALDIDEPNTSDESRKDSAQDEMDVANTKYSLQLDPEENLNLFYSQHSFKCTQLR